MRVWVVTSHTSLSDDGVEKLLGLFATVGGAKAFVDRRPKVHHPDISNPWWRHRAGWRCAAVGAFYSVAPYPLGS